MEKRIAGVHLIRGEDVVDSYHPVFWIYVHHYFVSIALIFTSAYLYLSNTLSLNEMADLITLACVLGGGIIWLAYALIINLSKRVIITNKRVLWKQGVLERQIVEIDMDKIHNVKIHQSLIEQILNYGTISIDTAGSEGFEAVINGVHDINKKQAGIKHLMEADIDAAKEHKKLLNAEELLAKKKEEIKELEKEIKEMDREIESYEMTEKKLEEKIKKEQELLKKLKEKKSS